MARPSVIPQELMRGAMIHLEQGVPIDDLDIKPSQRARLARVEHVYWQWVKNPFLDVFQMFKQLIKGKYADPPAEYRAAQKDKWLFDFIVEQIATPSRKVDEARVRAAANQAIRIGMETDNVMALTKGGKLLSEVAHLNQPEEHSDDMSKVAFLPSVVVTDIREVDDTKENIDDEETKRIISKYGGFVDEKRKMIEEKVDLMLARDTKQNDSQ